jgi:hypothetical protein
VRGRAEEGLSHFAPILTMLPRSPFALTRRLPPSERTTVVEVAHEHLLIVLELCCHPQAEPPAASPKGAPRDLPDAKRLKSTSGAATTSPSSTATPRCSPTTSPVPPTSLRRAAIKRRRHAPPWTAPSVSPRPPHLLQSGFPHSGVALTPVPDHPSRR